MSPRYIRNPAIHARAIDTDTFLVDDGDQNIYHLNNLGSAFWRLLAEPTDVDAAAHVFALAFPDMDKADIQRDLMALTKELSDLALIQELD